MTNEKIKTPSTTDPVKRTEVEKIGAEVVRTRTSCDFLKTGKLQDFEDAEKSLRYTRFEHSLGFWEACRYYRPAVLWCLFVNTAVILCGFDGALIGSLVGLTPFTQAYGTFTNGEWVVAPSWLSAFNYASLVGSIPGCLTAGLVYDRLGPRLALGAAATGSIGSIFFQFFSKGPALLFVGELLNGFIIGFYPVISNSYISEVAPLACRGVIAALMNISYVGGQLIASCVLKGTSGINSKWSYKIPFAAQWLLPVFILSLLAFCPTPPYWLCRRGRYDDAHGSLKRLTTLHVDTEALLANIKETIRQEESNEDKVTILDCFRGTNLRRTIITCMVYNITALCGNIFFINYAVYFMELAGLSAANSYSMNIGLTGLGVVGNLLSYSIIQHAGRRTIYIWGGIAITIIMFLVGILGAVPHNNNGPVWAMCAMMALTNLIYDLSIGPVCFTILAETSATNLRGLTIALSNITVNVCSVVFAVGIAYALDANGANWGGRIGFLFAGIGVLDTVWCWFYLPETKGRTFEEIDFMFQQRIPTRKFKAYKIEGIHPDADQVELS